MSGVSYAHNCYLQIAVETGIFSLLAFLWMIIVLFVSSLRSITGREEGLIKAAQIGLLAGLLAYLTHSALETNLYSLQLVILFYYFLGVAISIQKIKDVSL
jgi:O-antigen ligase